MSDLTVENHGSIFLLRSNTEAGEEWIDNHIPGDAMVFGGAIVVEHHYIEDIVIGATNDGMVVE